MAWCGYHQRAYRKECVACRAETVLRRDRDEARARWAATERALYCPGEGALPGLRTTNPEAPGSNPGGRAFPGTLAHQRAVSHRWQKVLGDNGQYWECVSCGRRVWPEKGGAP